MPGNLYGQGMGNVELSREEHGPDVYWDRPDHGHSSRERGSRGRDRDWGGDSYGEGRGGRGGSEHRRDWERNREWGNRRDDDRGYRERRGRRDWEDERRHEKRDYRDSRERDRDRDRGGRRSNSHSDSGNTGAQAGKSEKTPEVALPATEDWSDDEITLPGLEDSQTENLHKNVADELANFDKQFLPSKHEDKA